MQFRINYQGCVVRKPSAEIIDDRKLANKGVGHLKYSIEAITIRKS
jgi:hypothetical protein